MPLSLKHTRIHSMWRVLNHPAVSALGSLSGCICVVLAGYHESHRMTIFTLQSACVCLRWWEVGSLHIGPLQKCTANLKLCCAWEDSKHDQNQREKTKGITDLYTASLPKPWLQAHSSFVKEELEQKKEKKKTMAFFSKPLKNKTQWQGRMMARKYHSNLHVEQNSGKTRLSGSHHTPLLKL